MPTPQLVTAMESEHPPITLSDLPADVLSLILSHIADFYERFRYPPRACAALRAAARPPSLAWRDVFVDCCRDPADLPSTLETAGTAVRRLALRLFETRGDGDTRWGLAQAALAATCRYLEELDLIPDQAGNSVAGLAEAVARPPSGLSSLRQLSVAAVRVGGLPGLRPGDAAAVRALLDTMSRFALPFLAPHPLLPRGGAGSDRGDILRIHQGVQAVAARPVRLVGLDGFFLTSTTDAADVQRLAQTLAAGLTRVGVDAARQVDRPTSGASAACAALVAALPDLADLEVRLHDMHGDVEAAYRPSPAVALDLRAVPPQAAARLTRLSISHADSCLGGDIILPPAMAGRLLSLRLGCATSGALHPPRCLHAGSGCGGPFSRLTRLVYGGGPGWGGHSNDVPAALNLAAWGQPQFSIPTLRTLVAVSRSGFTLEGYTGDWAAAVAQRTLPCLSRLELVHGGDGGEEKGGDGAYGATSLPVFTCRSMPGSGEPSKSLDCTGCGQPSGACLEARAVREAVVVALPAAARAGGRRLDVRVRRGPGTGGVPLWEGRHQRPGIDFPFQLILEYKSG